MMRRSRFQACGWIIGLSIFVTFLVSCESRDKYVGVYHSEAKGSAKQGKIILELKENGDGVWRVSSDEVAGTFVEVPFAWYIKRGDLRVNTKAGGVIVGKIDKDTIQMTLPGSKALTFRKTQ
jgi:hypothetical protein